MLKLGSHVSMSQKEMFFGSAKEAKSYGANVLMVYTGAPQNTRRKDISELNIEAGWDYMKVHHIDEVIIHAPYIINLANTIKVETFELATKFLAIELDRTVAMGSEVLVLHPGAHVGAGEEVGIKSIIKGINEVLTRDTKAYITLETMAGKGTEIGRNFEELAKIYDGVHYNDKLRVCFDTCHAHDSGYDIIDDFDGVIDQFDKIIGKDQISVFHINDSKNPRGAMKDRHENIGFGYIGFDALNYIVHHKDFVQVPKILETPYISNPENLKISLPPYSDEISMLKKRTFNKNFKEELFS